MNFIGKFDAQLPNNGSTGHSYVHVEHPTTHAPADAIIVPDAHLLFGADFKRSGVDLILSNADRELVVHDYFKGEHHRPLASPDGAHLTGDIVDALTGHVDYAQAADGTAAVAHVIGHVTKLLGSATAVRNGVSIILNQGDNVEKGDVVATGPDSTLGVTFIDGTVFGLASNARMVLNEMVYDPNGSNNSSLISLVAGTISFVAGETAKHGDMKVDTPVATMGIRGTAVLVEIDFNVPGQNGLPDAKFQVLVEPDGTTGSYILFDKTTLDPIATVNQAGQQVNINQNGISYTNSPLSPELQKLISDVFTQKFSNTDTNTKLVEHFTDSIVPPTFQSISGPTTVIIQTVYIPTNTLGNGPSQTQGQGPNKGHVDLAPDVGATNASSVELPDVTKSTKFDTASGFITFSDVNLGDQPTASTVFKSFVYQNALHQDISNKLTPTEQTAVQAVEVALNITQDPLGQANGTAIWTYSVSDAALDFLGAGETLTLTYLATVSNNFGQSPLTTTVPITVTITGSNDVPKIDSAVPQTIAFNSGTSVPGGDMIAHVPTSGTITFDDPDLTDTHTVSVSAPISTMTDPTTGLTTAFVLPPKPAALFDGALTASIATDSTGTGDGTINWSLADLPVWLGDYIPKGDTLTITYVVTVTDSQGATSFQDITVTITGTDTPAEVWVATTTSQSSGGLWSDGANWETGNAPTVGDDAIIITNQLEGLTPTYPVTIATAAVAQSLEMDNYGGNAPLLINQSTLAIGTTFDIDDHSTDNPPGYTGPEFDNQGTATIGGAFSMSADAIVNNSGFLTVDGKMEVLDQSSLQNSGTITLAGGGDFSDQSTISNTTTGAMIDVTGGTLNVGVDISNLGTIEIDSPGALTLSAATIDGGTVTIHGTLTLNGAAVLKNGILGNSSQINVSGTGNALDNETVTNTSFIEVMALGALTLDLLTTVGNAGHTITVDGTGTLTLQGGSSITGGSLVDTGTLDIEGTGATLDGVTVTGAGAINVDTPVPATTTLVLKDVTSITDGTLTVGTSGILLVAGSATLDDVQVANQNSIEVIADNGLTLDDGTTVDNTIGTITVDGTGRLTLNKASIDGGTINNFSTDTSGDVITGDIDVTGDSTISNAALNKGNLKIEHGVTLTLDGSTVTGTSFDDTASGATIQIDGGEANTLTLNDASINGGAINDFSTDTSGGVIAGDIDVTGDSTISNAALNKGDVTVGHNVTLTLDGGTVTGTSFDDTASGATIQIDGGDTLKLSGVHINGGAINDFSTDTSGNVVAGDIDVTGDSTISNAALNKGDVTVGHNVTLTLDGSTVTGTSFDDTASGATIQIDGGDTLKLSGVHINGGAINDFSTDTSGNVIAGDIDVTGDSTISNAALNKGDVTIGDGFHLTLDGSTVTGTSFDDTASGATIQIDGNAGDTVHLTNVGINGGDLTVAANGLLQTSGNVTLTNTSVTNDGTIEVTGGKLTISGSVADSVGSDGGTIQIDGGAVLDLNASDTQNVLFSGTGGELKIDTGSFGGSIVDLAPGDQIDLSTIGYGLGTYGIWVSNADDTGGTLTITDANNDSITLQLVGDYSNGHFAGATDNHGGTLITLNAVDDAPSFAPGETAQTATVAEIADSTGLSTADDSSPSGGAIHFTDIDLTDRPTATVTSQIVTWSGGTPTGAEVAALDALKAGFALTPVSNTNNGEIDWTYSITDSSLDFLAAGETATVTSTITLNDHQGGTDTATVTVTIDGANDAPFLLADTSGTGETNLHGIAERAGETGDTTDIDSASGTLSFTDADLTDTHTPSQGTPTFVWSGGELKQAQIDALTADGTLALSETDSTGSTVGSIGFTYSAADSSFDFLAAGETLTVTYEITVTDKSGVSSSQPVTFTVTGSNDAPVLATDTSGANGTGLHAIAERAGETGDTADTDSASGTLSFNDVDLSDTHQATESAPNFVWSGGSLTTAQINALTAASTLALSETDSTHTGTGSVGFTYSAADNTFDFLAAGQTLTVTYDITVTDNNGASSSQPVTFTVTGSNDAPTIVSETDPATQTIILAKSPIVLSAGTTTNALGLPTETFDERGISVGSTSNNGAGHGNFTSDALGATFSGTGDAGVVHGSSSVTAPPFIGPEPGHADTTNYLSIGAHGSETITFATEQNQFGLYWGSVDSFNTISFYDGSELVASYSGAAIAPLLANGNQGSFASNGYVEFSDLAPFTKVVLSSGSSNAFEVDNISAGFISDSHVQLAGPITGTITVNDADIGDTLTASVTGDAVAEYNGSTTLPSGVDISALIASGAITFDTVTTTGGQDVLEWTYNPTNPDLDFLEPGDKLTLTFNATVSDGHATTADQALTITLVGNGSSSVNGTAQDDTFTDVGGGVTISGHGGHDTYNFNAHFGSATITDFDVSHDVIDISSTLFTSVSALLNDAAASGVNTVITDSAGDTITLDHVSVAQLKANPGDFQLTIAAGGTFEAAASTSENIVFEGSTGKLTLDTPSSFTGIISGFTGDGTLAGSDQIDLKGINHNSASFTESYNATNDTLFVSDGTHSTTLHFTGAYQAENFSFVSDGNGGTIVYDPPVGATTTPGAATETQAVTATNDGFVFDFADKGQASAGGVHPANDSHLFDSQMVTDAGAALSKLHVDDHAAPIVPVDSHDPSGAVNKAQWHASDFHFV